MGKVPRVDLANLIYHAYNRGNAGGQIFVTNKDYMAFEHAVAEARERAGVRILAYCVMPNHWHFVLHPTEDNQLRTFFHWLTLTHTQRWHVVRGSVGTGHIYQGRYKSNICENEYHHFLRLVRYVERNALRANLVQRAEHWRWSSAWRRTFGSPEQKKLLADWPISVPENYLELLNSPQSEEELAALRLCLMRGRPYGEEFWTGEMVDVHKLESTLRNRGRPSTK